MKTGKETMMFKTKIFLMSFVAVLGSALIGLMLSNSSNAANPEPIVVQVAFVAPITITTSTPLTFGSLDQATAIGETVDIATNSAVTESVANIVVGGIQAAATANTVATPGRPINILVDTVTTGTGYTLHTWLCDYDGGAAGTCDGLGLSETSQPGGTQVRVGVTLEIDAVPTLGDQDGGFELTVSYE
jgi:hypothetical protein